MPVLINNDSGNAEDIADPHAALAAGSHEVPLVSPDGDFGSAPLSDAKELMAKGYTQPSPDQLSKLLNEAKYGSTSQQVIGGAEQVAKGALGPLATGAELALGVKPEDMRGREESKGTVEKMIEQGAGLVGSSLIPGVGQAGVLEKAGAAGAHLLGLGEATSTIAKVGSVAAKAAIENAVYQSGDEVTKVMLHDPDQTAGSALMNIGLSGAIGAGVGGVAAGVVSPLWSATVGPRAENLLRMIANRANGDTIPMSGDLAQVIKGLEEQGIKVAPEIRAGLSDNPTANAYFMQLRESGTTTGDAINETMQKFKGDVQDHLANVFKTQEGMSAFEAGEKSKDAIFEKLDALHNEISDKYSHIEPHMEAIQIPDDSRLKFYNKLVEGAQKEVGTDSPLYGLVKSYADRVLAKDNINGLKQLATEIGSDWKVANRAGDFEKARVLSDLRGSIKEFQNKQMVHAGESLEKQGIVGAAEQGRALVAEKMAADKAYSQLLDKIGDVASVGKLGSARTHGQITAALEKVPAAKFADKLFDVKNIEGLRLLQKDYPEVLESLVQAKKTSMIEAASTKGELMHNQLLNAVNKLPKEVKSIMFKPEEMNTINASGKILRESGKRLNPSGTAKTLDKLQQHLPAGVGSMASMLLGHGAVAGALAGEAAKFLGRDVPDAARMSLLKFLGSAEAIDGTAWKAAGDYIHSALKGDALLVKASKAAIKSGQEVLPKAYLPDQKSRDKLDKKLKSLKEDSSAMLDVGGKIGHYMPDHASALAGASMNAVNYLNSLRPEPIRASPLDSEIKPSKAQMANYNRALDIAEQPLILCKSIQDGTLTPMDIKHINTMFPTVYNRMAQGLTAAMVDQVHDESPIKYQQRIGLSLFLAQPLDSTMSPQNIIAAQPTTIGPGQQQQMAQKPPTQSSSKAMTNLAKGNATGGQMREMQKAGMAKA